MKMNKFNPYKYCTTVEERNKIWNDAHTRRYHKTFQQRFKGLLYKSNKLLDVPPYHELVASYREAQTRVEERDENAYKSWASYQQTNHNLAIKDELVPDLEIINTYNNMVNNLGIENIQRLHDFLFDITENKTNYRVNFYYKWIKDNNLEQKSLEELKILWRLHNG